MNRILTHSGKDMERHKEANTMHLRLPPKLHAVLKEEARLAGRTMHNFVLWKLNCAPGMRRALENYERNKEAV